MPGVSATERADEGAFEEQAKQTEEAVDVLTERVRGTITVLRAASQRRRAVPPGLLEADGARAVAPRKRERLVRK